MRELVHYFGVVRGVGGWHILDDAGHTPQGLTGVSVNGSGRLVIAFEPLIEVGTFTITPDETWCGRYFPGASVGFDKAVVTIRDGNGAVVSANSSVFDNASGNWFVDAWGWADR